MEAFPNGERATAPSGVSARAAWATVLIAAAIALLAITALIQSNKRAAAQSVSAQPVPSTTMAPLSMPPDTSDLGPFAFGYVEFDWDPANGVPGFDSWPPGRRSR
jgi:hypothetical protein